MLYYLKHSGFDAEGARASIYDSNFRIHIEIVIDVLSSGWRHVPKLVRARRGDREAGGADEVQSDWVAWHSEPDESSICSDHTGDRL